MTPDSAFFFVKVQNGGFQRVYFSDLYFIKSIGNYLQLVTAKGAITTHGSLHSIESMPELQPYLKRIHRSYMVNLEKMDCVSSEQLTVADHVIPVGSKYWDVLKMEHIQQHLLKF